MAGYYFVQEYEKGLYEDKAQCFTDIKKVFSKIEQLVADGKKFALYSAECEMDLT